MARFSNSPKTVDSPGDNGTIDGYASNAKPKSGNDFYDILGKIIDFGVKIVGVVIYIPARILDNFVDHNKAGVKVLAAAIFMVGIAMSSDSNLVLAPDYDPSEFAPLFLLEQGDVDIWVRRRGVFLLDKSKEVAKECEAGKLASAITVGASVVMSANPLAWLPLTIGAIGYVYTVFQEFQDTGSIRLIPMYRGKLGDILKIMEGGQAAQRHPLEDQMEYLSEPEKDEVLLLNYRFGEVVNILGSAPPKVRFDLYRHLCGQFHARRDLLSGDEVRHYITAAVSPERRTAIPSQPPALMGQAEEAIAHQPVDEKPADVPTQLQEPVLSDRLPQTNNQQPLTQPSPQQLLPLPLKERAIAIIEALAANGFDLSRAIGEQITCICGNQRGGKGTLMAILAVLASAIEPNTKIHYFTAGDDIYPFRCDRLVCRLNFPKLDGTDADQLVAGELYRYLKEMDNATQGEYSDIILVIDEAVALSDYLDPDQKQWIIRFLLTRANKKGAQIFIVLHGSNLTSWVGTGNTGGFSSTFKTGVTFIGCEATSKKISPLRSISVATGHYFIASPDDFSKPVEGGELGMIPDWFKTETNPSTGQPDPVRALLKFFPELKVGYVGDIGLEKKDVDADIRERLESLIKATPKDKLPPQTELAQKVLEIIQSATKYPISFESIRKSRKWESSPPDKTTLLATLEEITPNWIRGSEEDGYYIQD